jgi:CheY-like chemotaxis protein
MNYLLASLSLMTAVVIYEQMHRQQQQELDQRNAELRATHHALIQAQAHKDEFVAAVGHELRTPMNAILGFNGVLRRELADQPDQVEVVDHIRRSTAHLLQVINDILDFSQLQVGKLSLHPTDIGLKALVDEALERYRVRARDKGLVLEAELDPALPPLIHADRQRLQQVLHNLLDNAVKFTEKGHVRLHMRALDGRLRIEVQDSGPGIAPERQAHIFNRFEHADIQTNRAYGGTGLGLALCEKLTRLQGGSIGVQSQPGQGALFWIELPLQAGSVCDETAAAQEALPPAPPLRILVVDDNAVNLQVAQLQLKSIWPDVQVVAAQSGAQALQLLDTEAFDVALLDMVMPEMDGLQLTQQIRKRFPAITARMPVLALTANTNPIEREQCLDAGMDDVLHKPLDIETMRRVILAALRKVRA